MDTNRRRSPQDVLRRQRPRLPPRRRRPRTPRRNTHADRAGDDDGGGPSFRSKEPTPTYRDLDRSCSASSCSNTCCLGCSRSSATRLRMQQSRTEPAAVDSKCGTHWRSRERRSPRARSEPPPRSLVLVAVVDAHRQRSDVRFRFTRYARDIGHRGRAVLTCENVVVVEARALDAMLRVGLAF